MKRIKKRTKSFIIIHKLESLQKAPCIGKRTTRIINLVEANILNQEGQFQKSKKKTFLAFTSKFTHFYKFYVENIKRKRTKF